MAEGSEPSKFWRTAVGGRGRADVLCADAPMADSFPRLFMGNAVSGAFEIFDVHFLCQVLLSLISCVWVHGFVAFVAAFRVFHLRTVIKCSCLPWPVPLSGTHSTHHPPSPPPSLPQG